MNSKENNLFPQVQDKVVVTIKDNNQIINGTVIKLKVESNIEYCTIKLDGIIKIDTPTEAVIIVNEKFSSQAIIEDYNRNNNLLILKGLSFSNKS